MGTPRRSCMYCDHSLELIPIMSAVACSCHVPPRSRTSCSRPAFHPGSESISTPSRSNTTATGSPTDPPLAPSQAPALRRRSAKPPPPRRPYRRACQHLLVPSDDVEAIRSLIHEYAERIDNGDLDGVAALFTHGTWSSPGRGTPLRGADQVRRAHDGVILYDGSPSTK